MINEEAKIKRFSVIIAAYNVNEYIERAILSVENQTYGDIELIIVGGFSTDGTEEKIKEISKKYGNIKFIEQTGENKAAGGTRNRGIEEASGEYIIFLDGDDCLAENDVLERLDNLIGDDLPDIIYMGFQMEGDKTDIILPTEETCTKKYKASIDKYANVWSKCWRREYLNENNIRFPEGRYYEDLLVVYNGVMKSKSYKIADFVVHKYTRHRKDSMTTKVGIKNLEDTVSNIKDLMEIREKEYTEEIDLVIKKEVDLFKKRLDKMVDNMIK